MPIIPTRGVHPPSYRPRDLQVMLKENETFAMQLAEMSMQLATMSKQLAKMSKQLDKQYQAAGQKPAK